MVKIYQPVVEDNRVYKVRLQWSTGISSNAAGTINTVFGMDPSSSGEWVSNTNLYDDFRVLGIRLRLISTQQFSVTKANDALVIAYDDNSSAALGTLDAGLQYNTHHLMPCVWSHSATGGSDRECVPTFMFLRPNAGKNTAIPWIPTNTPAGSIGAVKFFATNLTVSTTYLVVAVDWYCEFRGRN